MLSFGSRDDEPVRYLTLAAKNEYKTRGKPTFVEESAFIEAVIASTVKSFSKMKMFEKCRSLKRCGSTLITISWNIFKGSLNGLNMYTASKHFS